jgi:hypothetical protein
VCARVCLSVYVSVSACVPFSLMYPSLCRACVCVCACLCLEHTQNKGRSTPTQKAVDDLQLFSVPNMDTTPRGKKGAVVVLGGGCGGGGGVVVVVWVVVVVLGGAGGGAGGVAAVVIIVVILLILSGTPHPSARLSGGVCIIL